MPTRADIRFEFSERGQQLEFLRGCGLIPKAMAPFATRMYPSASEPSAARTNEIDDSRLSEERFRLHRVAHSMLS